MKKIAFIFLFIQCILIFGCRGKDITSKQRFGKDAVNSNIDSSNISEARSFFQYSRDSVAVLDLLYFTNGSFSSVLEQLINRKGGEYPENYILLLRECEEGTALFFNHVHEETNRIIECCNGKEDGEYQSNPDIQIKGCLVYNNLNIIVEKYVFDDDKIVDDLFEVRRNKVLLERQPVIKNIEKTETGETYIKIYHETVSYYFDGKTLVKKPSGMLKPLFKYEIEDVSIKKN